MLSASSVFFSAFIIADTKVVGETGMGARIYASISRDYISNIIIGAIGGCNHVRALQG